MDLSIFGYKLNVQLLILIGVVYLVLVGHTVGGCSSYGLMEGLEVMAKELDPSGNIIPTSASASAPAPASVSSKSKHGPSKISGKVTETFVGANTNQGQSSPYDLATQTVLDTSAWSAPDMTIVPGKPVSDGVKQFQARKQQPLPLKDGEMDFFSNAEFKAECCPSAYSNSSGCWCGTSSDYNYLVGRGGNNVPYSEY